MRNAGRQPEARNRIRSEVLDRDPSSGTNPSLGHVMVLDRVGFIDSARMLLDVGQQEEDSNP